MDEGKNMKSQLESDSQKESVRKYFAKLAWQSRPPTAMLNYAELDVESFFVGLQKPPTLINAQRKESAKNRQTLQEMFAGFRWE